MSGDRSFTTQPNRSEKCTECGASLDSDVEQSRGVCNDCA